MKINPENTRKKWEPFLEKTGLSGFEYSNLDKSTDGAEDFQSILPVVKKIAAQTIGLDLVAVKPIGSGNSDDELNRIKSDVASENRDRKIDSLLEDKEFEQMEINQHPDFKPFPTIDLMYLDFKYGGTESNII